MRLVGGRVRVTRTARGGEGLARLARQQAQVSVYHGMQGGADKGIPLGTCELWGLCNTDGMGRQMQSGCSARHACIADHVGPETKVSTCAVSGRCRLCITDGVGKRHVYAYSLSPPPERRVAGDIGATGGGH